MNFIRFQPNQPQSFFFPSTGPYTLPNGAGCLYPLSSGEWLYLGQAQADSLALLNLMGGEEFAVCLYGHGKVPEWQVWLTPATEKARAAVEVRELDLEAQLGASLKLVQGKRNGSLGGGIGRFSCSSGTEGPVIASLPAPLPRKEPALAVASGRRRGSAAIPYNVAFREIVQLVAGELKAAGEQWSDQARQDAVSTLFIAAGKAGWLSVWEREDAA